MFVVFGRDENGYFRFRLPKKQAEKYFEKKIVEPGTFAYIRPSKLA